MRRLAFLVAPLVLTGVLVARPPLSAAPEESVTFARDVAPILNAKCISCHRPGEAAPMSLVTYQDVRPWAVAIKAQVASRRMPPWFADRTVGTFANDPSLSANEIAIVSKWVDGGALQGNSKDVPKSPQFTHGWRLGEPDYIVELPEVQIPATGADYFPTPNITLGLKEDRWIRAVEIRPSNHEVAHHSVIFSSSVSDTRDLRDIALNANGVFDVLAVWAVGSPPVVYTDGSGRWVRKGQTLRTNLHYHPNGTPQIDRTRVGLYFGKGELKKEVVTAVAGNLGFAIPPNAAHHELRATYVTDQDISVVSFFPHMHLRGKDMSITATYPDGRTQPLLNVPSYNFNWQLFYYPKSRLSLPRGTRVDVVAHYDNSAANKSNPDPSRRVTFGEDSTAEMMFGIFEFTADAGVSPKPSTDRSRLEALTMTLAPESTFLVDFPFTAEPTPAVLALPTTGAGSLYLSAVGGMIATPQIQEFKWEGNSFSFQTALLLAGNPGSGFYTVTGQVDADGSVRGTLRRRGNGQPPSYDFTGARRK